MILFNLFSFLKFSAQKDKNYESFFKIEISQQE